MRNFSKEIHTIGKINGRVEIKNNSRNKNSFKGLISILDTAEKESAKLEVNRNYSNCRREKENYISKRFELVANCTTYKCLNQRKQNRQE